jgi:ubiquinol-cytochrome c reductase cytochrome c1 subunit
MEFIYISIVVAVALLGLHLVMSKMSLNREVRILVIVAGLVGFTYWGIEPYAHHIMHPEPDPVDYQCSDLTAIDTSIKGDAANGKALVEMNCISCHGVASQGMPAPMSDADAAMSFGVVPPDLSEAGAIYETNYLANFIANPVKAMHLEHKFGPDSGKMFPMPNYDWMQPQEIMDMVAYLQSIGKAVDNKQAFEAACSRCHSMGYAGIDAATDGDTLKGYIGAKAPDLSQYIKSRGRHYLENFINDPQRLLHGTGMPRVGLTEEAQTQVIDYMEEIGDSKKAERESLGVYVLIFMLVFAVLATLWKKQIWRDLH